VFQPSFDSTRRNVSAWSLYPTARPGVIFAATTAIVIGLSFAIGHPQAGWASDPPAPPAAEPSEPAAEPSEPAAETSEPAVGEPGDAVASGPGEAGLRFFETKIRPLLIDRCVGCHGEDDAESDLRLDHLSDMLAGGVSGPAVVPGKLDESLLIAAISFQDELLQMPPDGKLPDAEIELLKEWIARGAPHPEADGSGVPAPRKSAINLEEAKKFWSFRPLISPQVPAVQDAAWVINPIDAFVLSKLESEGLTPSRPADKRTLLRRVTYDLTGLPPTPEAIEAFLADESPDAYARVIDYLLESKEYGEHWGRHWLDIARYADSNGLDENVAHGNAWRYRDYVIRSLNQDKPLDRFLVEQMAGDLLANEELAKLDAADAEAADATEPTERAIPTEIADLRIATGFLTLGPKVLAEADKDKMRMDIIDEQIDTIGRAFLGLTLGCARCHDHKFDPVSTADYYALAGILGSTRTMESLKTVAKWYENPIPTEDDIAARRDHQAQIAERNEKIASLIAAAKAELAAKAAAEAAEAAEKAAAAEETKADEPAADAPAAEAVAAAKPDEAAKPEDPEALFSAETKAELQRLRDEVKALEKSPPPIPTAMGVTEEQEVADVRIHVRGSHLTLGATVPRNVPAVLAPADPLVMPSGASGRLEFANWMASPENPLTSRVMANRVWRWHFGRGLVSTTDNFGLLGDQPSHPELLDWLAAQWTELDWSLKSMHRLILLSNTYQLSSEAVEANLVIDPDNRFRWRADVRRLQAESIRDGMLAASGLIDGAMGGSMLHVGNYEFIFNHTSKDDTSYDTYRRSIYLPVIRNNLYDGFSLFDYSTADVVNGDRETSTVAPQALFLLNSGLVMDAANALADRLLRDEPQDDARRVVRLYQLTLARYPETEEADAMLAFVEAFRRVAAERAAARVAANPQPLGEGDEAQSPTAGEPAEPVAGPDPLRDAWVAACQGLLVCNEFHYVP